MVVFNLNMNRKPAFFKKILNGWEIVEKVTNLVNPFLFRGETKEMKLFSLFKHEEKHLYCHNSEKHIDNYRIYEMVWLPKYCPEFLDSNLKKVYHNLPTIIKEQKTFLTDFQKSFGKKNKINKLIF